MVGDLFSAFVLTRTISEGPLPPGGVSPAYQTGSPKDLGTKFSVSGSWYQDPGTEILVPTSWYQDLGNKILVPGSWYQDLGTKILVPRSWYQKKTESPRGGASRYAGGHGGSASPPGIAGSLGGGSPRNNFMDPESKIDASCGSGAHPYQNPLYEQKVGPHINAKS